MNRAWGPWMGISKSETPYVVSYWVHRKERTAPNPEGADCCQGEEGIAEPIELSEAGEQPAGAAAKDGPQNPEANGVHGIKRRVERPARVLGCGGKVTPKHLRCERRLALVCRFPLAPAASMNRTARCLAAQNLASWTRCDRGPVVVRPSAGS